MLTLSHGCTGIRFVFWGVGATKIKLVVWGRGIKCVSYSKNLHAKSAHHPWFEVHTRTKKYRLLGISCDNKSPGPKKVSKYSIPILCHKSVDVGNSVSPR